jgi:hypothetical protein
MSRPAPIGTPLELSEIKFLTAFSGGGGWTQETPYESAPSRDFVLPPAGNLASDPNLPSSGPLSPRAPSTATADGETSRGILFTIARACAAFNLTPHFLHDAMESGSVRAWLRASDITTAIDVSRKGDVR